jgi:hypothetical protein
VTVYLTAVTVKKTVFWDVVSCSLVESCRFGRTFLSQEQKSLSYWFIHSPGPLYHISILFLLLWLLPWTNKFLRNIGNYQTTQFNIPEESYLSAEQNWNRDVATRRSNVHCRVLVGTLVFLIAYLLCLIWHYGQSVMRGWERIAGTLHGSNDE